VKRGLAFHWINFNSLMSEWFVCAVDRTWLWLRVHVRNVVEKNLGAVPRMPPINNVCSGGFNEHFPKPFPETSWSSKLKFAAQCMGWWSVSRFMLTTAGRLRRTAGSTSPKWSRCVLCFLQTLKFLNQTIICHLIKQPKPLELKMSKNTNCAYLQW